MYGLRAYNCSMANAFQTSRVGPIMNRSAGGLKLKCFERSNRLDICAV